MKTYIMMNKTLNRVVSYREQMTIVFSGSLDVEMFHNSFKPVEVKNTLLSKIKAWWNNAVIIEVELKQFTAEHFNYYCGNYVYLQRKSSGDVYRVWSSNWFDRPRNQAVLTPYGKVILPNGRSLLPEDFHVFYMKTKGE